MLFALLIPGIFLLDYCIKKKIEHAAPGELPKEKLGGFLTITRSHNYGMMMNTLDKKPGLVKVLTSISGLACLIWYLFQLRNHADHGTLFGGALALGGAASNIHDHLFRGYVVDYFKLRIRPIRKVIFNISDFCIFIGLGILVVIALFQKK